MKRWIVKAGSQLVFGGGPLLVKVWMAQVAKLRRDHDVEVVWVTSGAIATAKEKVGMSLTAKTKLAEKQALSAIGQPLVMETYNMALAAAGLNGAQILLTYDDIADGVRCENFRQTAEQLLTWGMVPILNENDAVATEEIHFGDNDSLSAKVARVLKADRLVILTDVEGLFDSDPSKNSHAKLISKVKEITDEVLKMAGAESSSGRGTGGMRSKLLAAREAGLAKIPTTLVKGDHPQILLDLAAGKSTGTLVGKRKSNK